MAVPGGQKVKTFNPPAWLVAKAKENAARLSLEPDALAKRLQEIKDNPEESKRKALEHAARMGVDPAAAAKETTAAARDLRPFTIAERPKSVDRRQESRTVSVEQEEVTSREVVMQPSPDLAFPREAQPSAPKPAPIKRREVQVEKRDERRTKKEKARLQHAKVLTKKSASKSASPDLPTPTFAESSDTGAAREAAASNTTSDSMDIDHSSSLFINQTDRYPVRTILPKWYTDIKDSSYPMMQLAKKRTPELTALEALKNCIGRCEAEMKRARLNQLYEELRDHVHKAEITIQVTRFLLKKARILHPENGLPRIFRENANFPSDLKADAYLLYTRWYKEDFSQDILRGVITVKGKDRNGDRLDAAYRAKHPANAKYYGEGNLVLGQWWPTQLCTVRDGAHGAAQGGIFGDKEHGAYSIVLSGGGYHDKDEGDVIDYSGTEGKNFSPTDATLSMIRSAELENEIRVIRSSMLNKSNKHRPELGLRYDGLYKIKSYVLVDKEKQIHRFKLERCSGQEKIRSEDNAARRPTQFEVAEFRQLKEKIW